MKRTAIILLLMIDAGLLFLASASAQGRLAQRDTIVSQKITTTANMIGIGHTNVLDDYLSNEKFRGPELRFVSTTEKFNPTKDITFQRLLQVSASIPKNNSETGNNLVGMINYSLAWYYNWHFLGNKLRLQAGGMADANFGGIMNTRNGNNAGQMRAYLNIAPSAAVNYDFTLWNHTLTARYSIDVPLIGLMFSPNYGQSYYEIFTRNDYDHNLVVTTIGSAPSMRQMLTLDFPVRTTTFRIGYFGDFQQANVNGIKSHIWSDGIIGGIVKRFILSKIR